MKALSVRQPWAWLIVHGFKDIENRTWRTGYRGPVLIHAGKKVDVEAIELIREQFPEIELPLDFETGGIVGASWIEDCVESSTSPWFCGPCGFVLSMASPCEFVPYRGQLGFFDVGIQTVADLKPDIGFSAKPSRQLSLFGS